MTAAGADTQKNSLGGVLFAMRPVLVEKVWGGGELSRRGKVAADAAIDVEHIGEAWEVADLPGGQSTVDGGPFAGRPLHSLVEEFGRELVGTAAPDVGAFPLLVKLIDASDDLSVQVHPNAAQAAEREGAAPKDECWLVLGTQAGARLAHGFVHDRVTKEAFRQALEDKNPEALLRFVEVKNGDVLRVSPGTVHAIGRGVFLLEVQEPSDTTYRVWDYERKGLDGKLRELHLEDALDVLRFGDQPPALVEGTPASALPAGCANTLLVNAPRYRLETLTLEAGAALAMQTPTETPLVLTVLEGEGTAVAAASTVDLQALRTVVAPAAAGTFRLQAQTTLHVAIAGLACDRLVVPLPSDEELPPL